MEQHNRTYIILILFLITSTAIGMQDPILAEQIERQECLKIFKTLPPELRQKIHLSMLHNAIDFLGQQPITLPTDDGVRLTMINNKMERVYKPSTDICHSIQAIDNNTVILRIFPNLIKTWDLMTGQLKQTEQVQKNCAVPYKYKYIINGNKMAVLSDINPGVVYVWNTDTNEQLSEIKETWAIATHVIAIDNSKIATGLYSGKVHVKDINTGIISHTFEADGTLYSIAMCDNKVMVVTAQSVTIWNLQTGSQKRLEKTEPHTKVAIYKNKAATQSPCCNASLDVWDTDTGEVLRTLKNNCKGQPKLALDDYWVVAAYGDIIQAWSLEPLRGTVNDNPLVWITQKADILQGNLIRRMCRATIDYNKCILVLPTNKFKELFEKVPENEPREQMDCRIWFTLPSAVRAYLRYRLPIEAQKAVPLSEAI